MTDETDSRWVEIETKIAYQDETILALNDVVSEQQKQIDQLETTLRRLIDHVRQLSGTEAVDLNADEKPPHY